MNNLYKVKCNEEIAENIYKMILIGDTSKITASGQFINIKVPPFFLRRPISICDYDQNSITIIYKVFGDGTKKLSEYQSGQTLDCLVGLGNGFSINNSQNVVLVGGGVGIPPLYNLAKQLQNPTVVLGFKAASEMFLVNEFKQLGCNVICCCEDGSGDFTGNVVEYLQTKNFDYYYSCGPEKMLLAMVKNLNYPGQLSFEERMGCGFGACMGCSKLTKTGAIRVCVEGPVLESEVVLSED